MTEATGGPVTHPHVGTRYEPTGNDSVDNVVESLELLDEAPVCEHVAVFETAHERLRAALADAADAETPS